MDTQRGPDHVFLTCYLFVAIFSLWILLPFSLLCTFLHENATLNEVMIGQ